MATSKLPEGENEKRPEPAKQAVRAAKKSVYKALVGLSFGDRRVEAGEIVDDLPKESVNWLLEGGQISKVEE